MKQVVISGYYGFDNTGDEAVLFSIIQALRRTCKQDLPEIVVLSNQPEKTSKRYGVKAIDRWNIKLIYKTLKKSDLLISGGGSLLQDITSNKTIPYYLLIIKMAQICKKEVVFYAQGFGPVSKKHNQWLTKKVLNKVNHIFVRDIASKQRLKEIGLTRVAIVVTADPVIGMETSKKLPQAVSSLLEKSKDKLRVGIYLRSWENDKVLIGKVQELCKFLAKEPLEMFFIPMQHPADVDFLKGIPLQGVEGHRITSQLDVEEVFVLTGKMDLVIGMRLHALIMAMAQGIPTVALSYDPKVDAFMASIENDHCFNVEEFTPQQVAKSVMDQISNMKKEAENILYKRQVLLKKVYEPAQRIEEILNKGRLK